MGGFTEGLELPDLLERECAHGIRGKKAKFCTVAGNADIGIAVVGEYIGKILEESKRRPHFIRRSIIKNGEARSVTEASEGSER